MVVMMMSGLEICFSLHVLNDPLVLKSGLSIIKIRLGCDNICIKSWCEVIHGVFGFVVVLLFPGRLVKFMHHETFCICKRVAAVYNIMINSKVWNGVVSWIAKTSPLLFVLSASS